MSVISMVTDYVIPFFLLLGVLIFVHEFGHFSVAKFFKVRVEVFSIGFGKKIFQYKKGDTNYCLSLIPLGGYVKMFGDDPSKDIPEEEKKYSFLHQPVWPRIAIVAAGPLINFFFAILIFFVMGLIGGPTLPAQVGDVDLNSAAYSTGFRSGDTVISVNGQKVYFWTGFSKIIEENADQSLTIDVHQEGTPKDKIHSFQATPTQQSNRNIFSTQNVVGSIEGLSPISRSSLIGVNDVKSTAYIGGLRSLDVITEINGETVEQWRQLASLIKKAPTSFVVKSKHLDDAQSKRPKIKSSTISNWKPNLDLSNEELLNSFGLVSSELYISHLAKANSFLFVKGDPPPAIMAGLKKGDRIYAINDKILKSWSDVLTIIKNYKPEQKKLKFDIYREEKKFTFHMQPEMTEYATPQGGRVQSYRVGFASAQAQVYPETVVKKAGGIIAAGFFGVERAVHWTKFTIMTFVRLAENKVSTKNIGGVLSIGKIASISYAMGIYHFLKMMAIISINLFILNLLPIPVLDGGHLVFFGIEALQGKPLSLRKMEMAQTFGMVLLLSLMVFSLFNDVTNLFSGIGF
ncbi:MAG: RIP metalloprotease RseP [Bdellovibrionaceae bacterium]|nr:RIP metalloprotease RseP [Pseudobdellovibrionaceae bacterium]